MSLMLPLLFSLALTSPDLQTRVDALMAKTQFIAETSLSIFQDGQWVLLETQFPLGEAASHVSPQAPLKKVDQVVFLDGMVTLFKAEHNAFNTENSSLFYWGPNQPLTLVLQTGASTVPGLVQLADLEAARGEPLSNKELKNLRKGKPRTDFDSGGSGALLQMKDTFFHIEFKTGAVTFIDPTKLGLTETKIPDTQYVYHCNVIVSPFQIDEIGPGGQLTTVFRFREKQKVANFFGKKERLENLLNLKAPLTQDRIPTMMGPNAGSYLVVGKMLFDRKGHVLSSGYRSAKDWAFAAQAPIIVANKSDELAIYDAEKAQVIKRIELAEQGYDMAVGHDGGYLAIAAGKKADAKDNSYFVYNLSSGSIVEELPREVLHFYMVYENMVFCKLRGRNNEIVVIDTNSNQTAISYQKKNDPFLDQIDLKKRRDDEKWSINSAFLDGRRIHFKLFEEQENYHPINQQNPLKPPGPLNPLR